jgi:hypothetical protein
MKRTALALAAAVLGTGCIVTSDSTTTCAFRTFDVAWTFTNADGQARGCASPDGIQPAIVSVDLFYDTFAVGRFPCGDYGVTLDDSQGGLTPGQHAILVEGVDAGGAIVVRDNYYANVASCGASGTTANAAEGYVRLDYTMSPVNACGGGYMWFAIHDDVANVTAAAIDQSSTSAQKTAYACGPTPVIEFPLAAGDYTLQWIEEVATPLAAPTALHEKCTPTAFSIAGPGTHPVPVTLVNATTGCQ